MATPIELKSKENKTTSLHTIVASNLSKAKVKIIKTLFKALSIDFTIQEPYPYDVEFMKKVEKGRESMRKGKAGLKVDLANLWK